MVLDQKLAQAKVMQIPKMYINGFPKAGLHLANRMAMGMFKQHYAPQNWFGTNAWFTDRHILEQVGSYLGALQPGEYIKGHTGYLKSIEAVCIWLGIGVVLVYRDFRDVAVSHMYHVLNDELADDGELPLLPHPNKQIYRDLGSNENILLAIIEGIGEFPGMFERWETFAPWLDSEWAMSISFEVMRNNPHLAASKFFDYCQDLDNQINGTHRLPMNDPIRKTAIDGIMLEMSVRKSPTFRKGLVGGWREEFTPAVVDCFKEHDNGWLVELGYEKDDKWQ